MKHFAKIQQEFVKHARLWDDMSLSEQKKYLNAHPKTKRRITAKPSKSNKGKFNINKLTDAGINKKIRGALGMADQYKDVNSKFSIEHKDGETVKVIHMGGQSKGKLKSLVASKVNI